MLCPQCNFEFNEAETDTCPACHHQPGSSMYLDASVKINDDSIIVDEHISQAPGRPNAPGDPSKPGMPLNAVFKKIIDSKAPPAGAAGAKAPAHSAPPLNQQQERRKAARKAFEELPPKKTPAAGGGAKSLVISVSIGAVLLVSVIGAGIYYLKYKAPDNAPAHIGSKTLILPAPAAPAPTYKTPPEEKPVGAVDTAAEKPPEDVQPAAPAAPEKAPGPAADTARQEMQTGTPHPPGADAQERSAGQADARSQPAAAPPTKESAPAGRYVLLCGSFKSRLSALSTAEKLKQQQFPAVMEEADLGARGVWYRIKVGGFSSKDGAEKTRSEIKRKLNIDALVSTKK